MKNQCTRKLTGNVILIKKEDFDSSMNTQTLKINIPDGFKINKLDEQTGEVSFEPIPKDIKERVRTMKETEIRIGN